MSKAEHERRLTWRFKVLQHAADGSRNIARTCRHFGISRRERLRMVVPLRGRPRARAGVHNSSSAMHPHTKF
jgi:hypothetical protein